jgi:hypothetical protein
MQLACVLMGLITETPAVIVIAAAQLQGIAIAIQAAEHIQQTACAFQAALAIRQVMHAMMMQHTRQAAQVAARRQQMLTHAIQISQMQPTQQTACASVAAPATAQMYAQALEQQAHYTQAAQVAARRQLITMPATQVQLMAHIQLQANAFQAEAAIQTAVCVQALEQQAHYTQAAQVAARQQQIMMHA